MVSFSLTVGVYDHLGSNIETNRGPYSITLSLTPTGTFSGTVTGSTTNGVITFTSLRILSQNTFTLTASSTGVTSAVSTSFSVVNYAFTITLTTSNSSPSRNFAFTITATINGEDGNAFTGACTLGLTESTSAMLGTTTATTSTGTATLSIYMVSLGQKTITGTCPASGSSPAVSSTVAVTVVTCILQITTFTGSVIYI